MRNYMKNKTYLYFYTTEKYILFQVTGAKKIFYGVVYYIKILESTTTEQGYFMKGSHLDLNKIDVSGLANIIEVKQVYPELFL